MPWDRQRKGSLGHRELPRGFVAVRYVKPELEVQRLSMGHHANTASVEGASRAHRTAHAGRETLSGGNQGPERIGTLRRSIEFWTRDGPGSWGQRKTFCPEPHSWHSARCILDRWLLARNMDSLDRFGDPSDPRTALVRNLYDRGCSLDQCTARREFVAFGASECRRNLGSKPAVSKRRILDARLALGARGRRRPHADRPRMAPSGRSQKTRPANRTTLSAGPRIGPQSLQGFRKRTTDASDGDSEPQEPIDGQGVCQSRLVLALRRGARSDRRQLRADGAGAEPSGAFGSPRE